MSWIDYLLIAVISVGVIAAVRHLRRQKGCCGDCRNCGKSCGSASEEKE